jgi:hypothetical protein
VGGFAAVAAVAVMKFREANLDGGAVVWVAFVFVVLWTTWFFSSLLAYWGAQRTTARVLIAFGSFWLLFVAADLVSEPSALGALMALAFVGPFFVLAWTARRWPRTTGVALLGVSAIVFGWIFRFGRSFIERPTQILTFVTLSVPMIACGIALLRERKEPHEAE